MEPVALGLGIYGATNTSLTLLERIVKILLSFGKRLKNVKDFPAKRGKLIELSKRITAVVDNIREKVSNYPPNVLETVESGLVAVFKDVLEQCLKDADNVLKKLEKYQEPSAGPSSAIAETSKQVALTTRMDSILKKLDEFESCLLKTLDAASNCEVHRHNAENQLTLENLRLNMENLRINTENQRKLDKAIGPAQPKAEEFESHFDRPELPDNLFLDFSSMETQEGRLMRKLLKLREKERVNGMSAVGRSRGSATHGMGGVGKTTALRAICYEEEVRKAFPDGICFLEFGENAKDINVQRQLERCIENFGGASIVAEIKQESSLEGAIHQAARWLRKREVLFVCDDLWRSPTNEYGYLPILKDLLVNAPRSKLLISTRDKRIAGYLSKNVEPFGTLPPEGLSARNLVGLIAFEDEQTEVMKRTDVQVHIGTILKVCAGLQLALCMAGHALRTAVEEQGDIRRGFEVYASQLKCDQRPDDAEGSAELYDHGLGYIVKASLRQCEQWAVKSLPKLNVHDLFHSLCVLEKQAVMPKSMLSSLWGISSRETDHVVREFANLGLLSKTKYETRSESNENETVEDYGVRLHDLILVLCQKMVGDGQKQRHQKFIEALQQSKPVWIDEAIPKPNEWWLLKRGDYVYGNLSRHMVKGGCGEALANLLSDVRWTKRRVKVGGWLALQMDFELCLAGFAHAEAEDIKRVYEVLKRHWSEVSKDERLLRYCIGGNLLGEEGGNKFYEQYTNSMMRYLPRPVLVPRWKFMERQDSREISVLTIGGYGAFNCMDYSRLGEVAVVGAYNKILLWSVSAQNELWTRAVEDVWCVAISANGKLIVSGHKNGTFRRWDAKSGEPKGVEVTAHSDSVECLAISKDGSTILTGSRDGTLRLWNAMNGEPKSVLMNHGDRVTCVAMCGSGSMIVSGSEDGTVCRWDVETNEMIGHPMLRHKAWVSCVTVSENGKLIVSGSADNTLVCWNAETGAVDKQIRVHSDVVSCVAVNSSRNTILSGSSDGSLCMWDTVNGKSMGEPFRGHFSSARFLAFTEKSGEFISGSYDGTIRRWRTEPSTRISESSERCDGLVQHIAFMDGGQKLVTCSFNGTLHQWDATNGKAIGKAMKRKVGRVIFFAIDEKRGMILAFSCTYSNETFKNEVIRWDTRTCEMIGEPIVLKHEDYIEYAAISSNREMIVTGSSDGTVQRWCTRSGEPMVEPMHGHEKFVRCAAISTNDEMVVTGSLDGSIIRWSTENGEQIGNPILNESGIDSISMSADGTVIVSSSYSGLCRWDSSNGQLLGESISKEWYGDIISTNKNCTKMVTWRESQPIRCWRVEPGGAIIETSTISVSSDIAACAVDVNHGIVAVGSGNGAFAVCDIHEQFDSVGKV